MFKVQYKSHNAAQAWTTHGSYGSESSALGVAQRISGKWIIRVLDPNGNVVWSA